MRSGGGRPTTTARRRRNVARGPWRRTRHRQPRTFRLFAPPSRERAEFCFGTSRSTRLWRTWRTSAIAERSRVFHTVSSGRIHCEIVGTASPDPARAHPVVRALLGQTHARHLHRAIACRQGKGRIATSPVARHTDLLPRHEGGSFQHEFAGRLCLLLRSSPLDAALVPSAAGIGLPQFLFPRRVAEGDAARHPCFGQDYWEVGK